MTPQRRNLLTVQSLARAVAGGESVASWCRRTGTARSTASKWQTSQVYTQALEHFTRALADDGLPQIRSRLAFLEQHITAGARPHARST
jgi:hypothetical protein